MPIAFDTRQVEKNLRKLIADEPQKRRKAMRDVAKYAEGISRDMTPVDTGTLTGDVKSSVQESGDVTAAVLCIPASAQSAAYAIPMHEHQYELGEKSVRKQGKTGRVVGRGYISRALEIAAERAGKIIESVFRKGR